MNNLPLEVELIIYQYLHEMYMADICSDLKNSIEFLEKFIDYLRRRTFYPYLILDKIYNNDTDKYFKNNIFFRQKIDKYIHYKKLKNCLQDIIKPDHIFFEN